MQAPWWRKVEGADWGHPEGPHSSIAERLDHPVVHVSWHDADAYCASAGARLSHEAEWEFAARGGLEGKAYPWGDELEPGGEHRMNVWQGDFPSRNTAADGFEGTAPVTSFPPNGYGLYNMTGNVWEWTADWFHPTFRQRDRRRDPVGPGHGTSRVQKGGSYLCHHSYCRRYRVARGRLQRPTPLPETSASAARGTADPSGYRRARDLAGPMRTPITAPQCARALREGQVSRIRAAAAVRRLLRPALLIAALVAIFGLLLPQFIDYEEVWEALTQLDAWEVAILLGIGLARVPTEALMYRAFLPGLSLWRGSEAYLSSNFAGQLLPPPSASVVQYGYFRGGGSEPDAAGLAALGSFLFPTIGRFVLPLVALVLLLLTGELNGSIVLAGVLSLVVTAVAGIAGFLFLRGSARRAGSERRRSGRSPGSS